MAYTLFSSCLGTVLLDEKLEVLKEIRFSKSDVGVYNSELMAGKWIRPELELLKGVEGRVLFLGFKRQKPENVSFTQDITKLERVTQLLSRKQLRKVNLELSAGALAQGYDEDIVVIHILRTRDEMEHVLNSIAMRLKDFAKLFMPARVDSADDARAILKLYKNPGVERAGYRVPEEHIRLFGQLAHRVEGLYRELEKLEQHLETTMKGLCPNLLGLAGPLLGARLLSIAGSLRDLAFMPYTTIQMLGAEKALFRHIRKGNKSPKHGILLTHPLVSLSVNRGRAARLLAEALSKAARMDYFKGKDISQQLLENIKRKLK